MFGSLYFIAVVISSLIMTPLADRPSIGRRKIMLIGGVVQIIAGIIQLFASNVIVAYVLIFFMGFTMPMRVFVGYIWATEFMQERFVGYFCAFVLGTDGLVLCVASLWFRYVSINWKTLQAIYLVMCIVGTIPLAVYFPDSP